MTTRHPIHPFPARMAPAIALDSVRHLPHGAVVLDPMAGSGTVLRQCSELGLQSIGRDLDPLAVLISRAWTSQISEARFLSEATRVIVNARALYSNLEYPVWLQDDVESLAFINFWFAEKQRYQLTALSTEIRTGSYECKDHLWVAFSRLIVTKNMTASLARDTAHSRPHRVADTNSYDVFDGFQRSCMIVAQRMQSSNIIAESHSLIGDARNLSDFSPNSIDAIVTSPPYLNAIDYMRGHRLSLVWMGWSIGSLREIRRANVGAEALRYRGVQLNDIFHEIQTSSWFQEIDNRTRRIVQQYCDDLTTILNEMTRVLKKSGQAVFVIGNSTVRGTYIPNSDMLRIAAEHSGLKLVSATPREIPENRRYLPASTVNIGNTLAKRMRSELVMEYVKL